MASTDQFDGHEVKWTKPSVDAADSAHVLPNQLAIINLYRYTGNQIAKLAAECRMISRDDSFYRACASQAFACAQEVENAFAAGENGSGTTEHPAAEEAPPKKPRKPRKPRAKKDAPGEQQNGDTAVPATTQ